jgi:hypothetical protein
MCVCVCVVCDISLSLSLSSLIISPSCELSSIGPFLQNVVATRVNHRTLTPHWPDVLVGESIVPSLEYMSGCYIQVVMFDAQERSPKAMGVGYLSLREVGCLSPSWFGVVLWCVCVCVSCRVCICQCFCVSHCVSLRSECVFFCV